MKIIQALVTFGLLLAALSPARAAEELDDEQLGQITAGSAASAYEEGRFRFDLQKTTGKGTVIGAAGDASLNVGSASFNTGVLQLQDNAQGNLRALVSTNAVNSAVQVLINLNINIDSQVGVLNQVNGALQQR